MDTGTKTIGAEFEGQSSGQLVVDAQGKSIPIVGVRKEPLTQKILYYSNIKLMIKI